MARKASDGSKYLQALQRFTEMKKRAGLHHVSLREAHTAEDDDMDGVTREVAARTTAKKLQRGRK